MWWIWVEECSRPFITKGQLVQNKRHTFCGGLVSGETQSKSSRSISGLLSGRLIGGIAGVNAICGEGMVALGKAEGIDQTKEQAAR